MLSRRMAELGPFLKLLFISTLRRLFDICFSVFFCVVPFAPPHSILRTFVLPPRYLFICLVSRRSRPFFPESGGPSTDLYTRAFVWANFSLASSETRSNPFLRWRSCEMRSGVECWQKFEGYPTAAKRSSRHLLLVFSTHRFRWCFASKLWILNVANVFITWWRHSVELLRPPAASSVRAVVAYVSTPSSLVRRRFDLMANAKQKIKA